MVNEVRHRYREAWLTELASQMQPFFRGFKLRPYRVTCGWPSRYGLGHKHIVVGECHSDDSSPDGIHEIFISPLLVKPIEVAGTLCHELAHVAAGVDAGHKGPFIRVCRHVGLTKGRPTQALPGPFLEGKVLRILERHGAYPHAGIIPVRKKVSKNESISLRCERCGCIIRISINWLDKAGFPKCGCGGSMSYTKEIGMS